MTRECAETRGCPVSVEGKVNSAIPESDFPANLAPKVYCADNCDSDPELPSFDSAMYFVMQTSHIGKDWL